MEGHDNCAIDLDSDGSLPAGELSHFMFDVISKIHLAKLPRRPTPVDITFEGLVFEVQSGEGLFSQCRKKETKTLLHNVSGALKGGEMTALMGPSGAGKSTLMNILAGLRQQTNGSVLINKEPRDMNSFRKTSCYIMQQDELLPNLTVMECMIVAANVKISKQTTFDEKLEIINDILTNLGLLQHKNTRTCRLSGGQKKRLSIAQELVNNPQVMFLDEPTSGLDSQASFECISMLQRLVKDGDKRTICCTIHQPSAKLFELFDKLYVMASGECIFRGSIPSVLPYLASQGLECPPYHNPADFVIEVACGVYGKVQQQLAQRVKSGDCDELDAAFAPLVRQAMVESARPKENTDTNPMGKRAQMKRGSIFESYDAVLKKRTGQVGENVQDARSGSDYKKRSFFDTFEKLVNKAPDAPATPSDIEDKAIVNMKVTSRESSYADWKLFAAFRKNQFSVLFLRTFKCILRDKNLTLLRMISHVAVGVLIGLLYYNVANDPKLVIFNICCIFLSLLFLMFTALMPTVMTFPSEITVFLREHMNSWYSLSAYYFAKSLADLPFQIVFPAIYTIIVYFLTGQPTAATNFFIFIIISILVSLNAQSLGLLIGAATELQVAVFLGPVTAIPILLFSGFFLPAASIPVYLRWISYLSYIRYAFEVSIVAAYGFTGEFKEIAHTINVTALTGALDPSSYMSTYSTLGRHMVDEYVLKELASNWYLGLIAMVIFFFLFRIAAFFVLLWRVRKQK